jgi:hypothetical protein
MILTGVGRTTPRGPRRGPLGVARPPLVHVFGWRATHLIFQLFLIEILEKLEIKWFFSHFSSIPIIKCLATKLNNWNTYSFPTFSIPSNIHSFF